MKENKNENYELEAIFPEFAESEEALREGIGHYGITQHQIDKWLKKYITIV